MAKRYKSRGRGNAGGAGADDGDGAVARDVTGIRESTAAIEKQLGALKGLAEAEAAAAKESAKAAAGEEIRAKLLEISADKAKKAAAAEELRKNQLEAAGKSFGKLEEGFGKVAEALRDVNPELAEAADKGAKVSGVLSSAFEGAAAGAVFGPWGAAIGGVTAGLADLGSTWMKSMGEISKIEAEAQERIKQTNEGIRQRKLELAGEEGEAKAKAFLEHLGAQEGAYAEINAQLERTVDLMAARRRAELDTAGAKAGLEIAKIDTDPSLSDEEKIRRKAAVEEGMARKKAQGELDSLTDEYKAAAKRRTLASGEANAQDKKVADIKEEIERQQEKARVLEDTPDRSDFQNEQIKETRERVKQMKAQLPGEEAKAGELRKNSNEIWHEETDHMRMTEINAEAKIKQYEYQRDTRKEYTDQRISQAQQARQRQPQRPHAQMDHRRDELEEGIKNEGDTIAKMLFPFNKADSMDVKRLTSSFEKNPTVAAADRLGDAIEKMAASASRGDAEIAQKLIKAAQKIETLESQLRKGGDGR